MDSIKKTMTAIYKFVQPTGWKKVERKTGPIPLVCIDLWKTLDDDERLAYCEALVKTQWKTSDERAKISFEVDGENVDDLACLVDEVNENEYITEEAISLPSATSIKQRKVRAIIPESGPYRTTTYVDVEWEIIRSPVLVAKLRRILDYLVGVRTGIVPRHISLRSYLAPLEEIPLNLVEPQMEDERGESLSTVSASNVVLAEENPASSDVGMVPVKHDWYKMSSSEFNESYEPLTNRWTLADTFVWTTSSATGSLLNDKMTVLPADFINKSVNVTMPMKIPFLIHRYCKMDIEIKLHINSNKFQCGQLQASWMYLQSQEKNPMTTIFERSQLPHVIVCAGSSNEATLTIPYIHVRPYLHCQQRKNYIPSLDLGNFEIRVLSPLQTGSNGPTSCSLSMFVRFVNSSFTGLIDSNLAYPQMEPAAMMAATMVIDKLIGDKNCDKPTSEEIPRYLVPTASHSWCLGSELSEPLQNLRLFNTNRGVGRFGEVQTNDLALSTPCSIFGMLEHIKWSSVAKETNKTGHCLWSMDAHPQCEKSAMYKLNEEGKMTQYAMPPVGVVASMFQQWRGSLQIRFDFVMSFAHTARVLVAYIPGYYGKDCGTVTLEQARNSAHVVFSLQDASSFTFTVPYIADKPWWFRKYGGPQRRTEFSAPSRVFMFILNPLTIMDAVSKEIRIIPYIRAGPDFEVAVPVQPAIGLNDNPINYINSKDKLRSKAGYEPWYCGSWVGFFDSKKYITRYGTGGQHVAQFDVPSLTLADNQYVYYEADSETKATLVVKDSFGNPKESKVQFLVIWFDSGYNYGIPFSEHQKTNAMQLAEGLKKGLDKDKLAQFCMDMEREMEERYSISGLTWSPKIMEMTDDLPNEINSYELVEPQMEDKRAVVNELMPTQNLPSSKSGFYFYKETFNNFKDIMRRYQLYWDGEVSIPKTKIKDSEAFLQFSALPRGLDLNISSSPIWNSLRDGHISLITSGYRFFRGGLRFKIVFPADKEFNVWIQHHPDMPADGKNVVKQYVDIHTSDRVRNHNYGYYVQSTRINNIVEFEIPFYQPGMYGLLRSVKDSSLKTDLTDYLGLGDVVVGFEGNSDIEKMKVKIYYSIGDDFSCNVFRGFNMMVLADEVFPQMEEAQPQMYSAFQAMAGSLAGSFIGTAMVTPMEELKSSVGKSIGREVSRAVKPLVKEVQLDIKEACSQVSQDSLEWFKTLGLTTAFGNLMHICANPTSTTVAIAVVNILVSLVSGSIQMLTDLTAVFSDFFSRNWTRFNGLAQRVGLVEPQGNFDDFGMEESKPLIAILFTAVCASLGASCKSPGGYFNLMRDINMTAMLSHNIIT